MSELTPIVASMNVKSVIVHHHVRLSDLAAFLDPETQVNVTRNVEVATEGAERVPYDEVILELTDDDAVQQLLAASGVPKSKQTLPAVALEHLLGAVAEVERLRDLSREQLPHRVTKGHISAEEAQIRITRLSIAAKALRDLAAMVPGEHNADLFQRAA